MERGGENLEFYAPVPSLGVSTSIEISFRNTFETSGFDDGSVDVEDEKVLLNGIGFRTICCCNKGTMMQQVSCCSVRRI